MTRSWLSAIDRYAYLAAVPSAVLFILINNLAAIDDSLADNAALIAVSNVGGGIWIVAGSYLWVRAWRWLISGNQARSPRSVVAWTLLLVFGLFLTPLFMPSVWLRGSTR